MADGETIGYRVTRGGDITAYRITQGGMYRIVHAEGSPPPPVPGWLVPVLRVRGMIYDPQASDVAYAERLPSYPPPGMAFTLGDGAYRAKPGDAWITLGTKFADPGIEDAIAAAGNEPVRAACLLISRLIARIQPEDYIASGNAGGQSVSFPSLESMLAFYRGLKADLLAEAAALAGTDTGRFFNAGRPAVGGVWEA